jgi:glycerophosphoryl diester phosphodiesterase
MNKNKKILIIGHKGASSIAPENTLRAFRKAIELKADFIEFDIHLSKDNEMVIIHDSNTFTKTRNNGLIKEMTLKELKQLDFGEGEKIPTLAELITIAKDRIGLVFDIKASGFNEKLVEILRNANLVNKSIVSSFSFNELIKIQGIDSNIKFGLILPEVMKSKKIIIKRIQKAINNKFFSIHPHFSIIDNQVIEFCHKNNLKVFGWTVNDVKDMRHLIQMGIDGIITDDIQLLKKVLN